MRRGLSGSIGGVRSIGARFDNQDSVSGKEDGKVKRRKRRTREEREKIYKKWEREMDPTLNNK